MPGPPPKPTRLKILQGNLGKRPLNDREPKPAPLTELPEPPAYLDAIAKEEWTKILTVLLRMRILTDADLDLVALYCDCFSKWREANDFLNKRGAYFPVLDESGKRIRALQEFPHTHIAKGYATLMMQIGDRLGLNPSARSRVVVPDGPVSDIVRRLLDPGA